MGREISLIHLVNPQQIVFSTGLRLDLLNVTDKRFAQ